MLCKRWNQSKRTWEKPHGPGKNIQNSKQTVTPAQEQTLELRDIISASSATILWDIPPFSASFRLVHHYYTPAPRLYGQEAKSRFTFFQTFYQISASCIVNQKRKPRSYLLALLWLTGNKWVSSFKSRQQDNLCSLRLLAFRTQYGEGCSTRQALFPPHFLKALSHLLVSAQSFPKAL